MSSKFELNKGKLPWLLSKAKITERYGIHKNKHISGVETKNNGIDFETDEGQSVRVVFDGKVSRIFYIKGKGKSCFSKSWWVFYCLFWTQGCCCKNRRKSNFKTKNRNSYYLRI